MKWRTPELNSTGHLPMLQANSSSGASDPAQMIKLFAKFWDQESGVFLVLKQKRMTFKIDSLNCVFQQAFLTRNHLRTFKEIDLRKEVVKETNTFCP